MERIQVLRRTFGGWLVAVWVVCSAAVALVGFVVSSFSPVSAQAATEVDLALIVTKRGLQEHVVDVSVNPPKTHLRILVKNQGVVAATAIRVAHRIPAGMQFAMLSSPALPTTTEDGSNVVVARDSDDQLMIDLLAPGDSVAIDVTLDVIDKTPGRFVNDVEIISMSGPDGEAAFDTDSTPDNIAGNDAIETTPGVDADDPQNSHNDIGYDQTSDGESFPTPNDEDDHDSEVVVVPAVVNVDLFLDPTTTTPLAAGQPVTFIVDLRSLGAPVESIEILHAIDASAWQPFALADNAVSSLGGREILWGFDDGGVTATLVGSMAAGERDWFPVTLTPASSFSGSAATLRHAVSIERVNGENPYVASFEGAVEGGVVTAKATAEMLDVALRLRVDDDASDLPPVPDSLIRLRIDVTNQGTVAVEDLRVFSHIDHESWKRINLADNEPSLTAGDEALRVVWAADEYGAEATIDGRLLPGQSVSFDVGLRIAESFTNPSGYLSTEAEVSSATAMSAAGSPLLDVDSEPDVFNYDATVDDVTDNSGGDEDDHDTAFINQRFAVGNQAWVDSNGDGMRSDDEDAMVGLELELFKLADDLGVDITATETEPVATTTTDGDGLFLFDGLAPGTYLVRVAESAREAGGAAFGMAPAEMIGGSLQDGDGGAAAAHVDGDNNAYSEASGRIAAGPVVLGEGLPEQETPRLVSTTADYFDDLTIDLGFVPPKVAEGSQDPDQTGPERLAFTGGAHRILVLLGMSLIVCGSLAVRVSARR